MWSAWVFRLVRSGVLSKSNKGRFRQTKNKQEGPKALLRKLAKLPHTVLIVFGRASMNIDKKITDDLVANDISFVTTVP